MMFVKSSITACGSSDYAGVCCSQFRRSVLVKGWYTYCMGPAVYDPSAWGNGGPRAWCRGHSTTAWVPASLLVSLPEFGNLPKWLVSYSRAIEGKGGYNKGAVGCHGWDFSSSASSFLFGSSELDSHLREARAVGRSIGTYGGGSGSSGSKVWWTSNFFSFTFPLTRTAVCLQGA
jgi:hypothetical protein